MIRSLFISNWRSHKNSYFTFSRGVNLLTGIMGAGKSSVMEALCFALFGTFPQSTRGRIKLEDLANDKKKSIEVKVELEIDGKIYLIEREIGKNSGAYIRKEGSLICSGSQKTTHQVEKLLGINYELFRRAIYSEQNNLDYLLSLDPHRRKAEIDELLGLDKFEKARANATTLANFYERQRLESERTFDPKKLDEVKSKFETKTVEYTNTEKKIFNLEQKTASIKLQIKNLKENLTILEKQKEKYKLLKEDLFRLDGRLENIRLEILQKKELCGKNDNKSLLESSLNEKRRQIEEKELQINKLLDKIKSFEAQIQLLESILEEEKRKINLKEKLINELKKILGDNSLEALKMGIEKVEEDVSRYREQISKSKTLLEEGKKLVSIQLSSSGGRCPLCLKPLSKFEFEEIIMHKKAEIKKLEQEILSSETCAKQLNEKLLKMKKDEQELIRLTAQLESIGKPKDIKSIEDAIEKAIKDKETMEQSLSLLRKEIEEDKKIIESFNSQLRLLDEIERLSHEEHNILSKLTEIKKELSSVEYSEKSFEEETQRLNTLLISLKETENSLSFELIRKQELQERISELSSLLDSLEKQKQHLLDLQRAQSLAAILKNCLLYSQRDIRSEYIGSINETLSLIWPYIYPYGDYPKVRIRADEKDYYFEVFAGEWRQFDGYASGGERACLSLALRIAIASVLTPSLSLLILDEPTHNLDNNAIEKLAKTLQDELPRIVEQSFIITHEQKLASFGFSQIYLLKRDKEKNGNTIVEKIDYSNT
ncbi:MAG: SMC family ATPase [Candidatus Anstonellales archaeon]